MSECDREAYIRVDPGPIRATGNVKNEPNFNKQIENDAKFPECVFDLCRIYAFKSYNSYEKYNFPLYFM